MSLKAGGRPGGAPQPPNPSSHKPLTAQRPAANLPASCSSKSWRLCSGLSPVRGSRVWLRVWSLSPPWCNYSHGPRLAINPLQPSPLAPPPHQFQRRTIPRVTDGVTEVPGPAPPPWTALLGSVVLDTSQAEAPALGQAPAAPAASNLASDPRLDPSPRTWLPAQPCSPTVCPLPSPPLLLSQVPSLYPRVSARSSALPAAPQAQPLELFSKQQPEIL